jgi:hypothetical protein
MKFEQISICPLCSFEADSDFELENHIHQKHSFILRKTEKDESGKSFENHSFILRKDENYESDKSFENHSFIIRTTEEDISEGLFIKDFIKLKYYNLVFALNLLSQVRYG